jgi:hypothetical protein
MREEVNKMVENHDLEVEEKEEVVESLKYRRGIGEAVEVLRELNDTELQF